MDSITGTYYGVLPSDVETTFTLNADGTYLLILSYKEKVERTGKVKMNFPSAWLQHSDACASFKWWAYLLQGEGCQPYYSDRFVWQWTPNRGKKGLHSEEGKIKCK